MKMASAFLVAALAVGPALAQHDHGSPQPAAEHEHSSPPAVAAPRPADSTPAPTPESPAAQLERLRRENPALGRQVDQFLGSVTRDNPDSSEEAMELALQIGGALEKIEKLKAAAKAGEIDKNQFGAMKAEALQGVSGALHGLMESDDSNGRAMRAVHRHFDGPLNGVGFDLGQHAKEMYKDDPGGFTSRYLAGKNLEGGDWPKAVEYAKQSLAYEPNNSQALGIIARGKFEQGDFGGANEAAKAALAIDRADPVANSIAALTKGRAAPSQAAVESARAPAPSGTALFVPAQDRAVPSFSNPVPGTKEAAALADKAQTYLRVGDHAAARAAAEKALALEPGQKRASLALSAAFLGQRDFLKALAALQEALKASGGRDPDLLAAQAGVLNRLGRYGEALASADLALRADPTKAAAHMSRAWALSGLGRRAEALEALRTAARLDPRYENAYRAAAAMPGDSDFLSLFVGDGTAAPAVPASRPAGAGRWIWAALGIGGTLGLLGVAFIGRKTR